ncbi:hypothetical protein SAMN06297129_2452 [Pseudooceanicola antarcticus]|uniref:Muramidase (Phage lambda lysozyme) n=1 Tax=Pseudooceanicola antarcticus TaxID=1247613 RepID=A0A285J1F0_9RHOB|nr:hypothetical protein [Pseudooceanicola antarcticus]PJE25761.1 hypothetical protein CVM39_18830 [Pseudooceanicola antarcticus]SNY52961.1 hypothetical protein SAMN06297129_2452 [Pseudooceanicola antarcticus]
MSGRGGLAAVMFLGAGFLIWKQQAEGMSATGAPMVGAGDEYSNGTAMDAYSAWQADQQQQQQQQSGGQMGFNFAPLLGWVLGKIGSGGFGKNSGGSSGTGSPLPGHSWGSDSGAVATGGGASAGGSAGAFNVQNILDLIGSAEAPGGYNQVYGGSKLSPPRPITTMTVGEVLNWQDSSVAAGSASSAAGRYQVIRGTLRDQVRQGTVSLSDTFDANTQDRIAVSLMEAQGLNSYQSGNMSAEDFGNRLARVWAGLPVLTGTKAGRSYYDGYAGNSATVSTSSVLNALRQASGQWV